MIVDGHVYSLPKKLRDPRAALPASEAAIARAIHNHPEGAYALSLSSVEVITASMDEGGIDRSLLVAFPWSDPALCRENNDHVLEAAAKNGRFRAVCAVRPGNTCWREEAERAIGGGAVGIKVNAAWQGFDLGGPEMDELMTVVEGRGAFLMAHIDQPVKASNASAAHLFQLARRHPRAKIVAAHMGGLAGLSTLHPSNAGVLQNVWYDTAMSSTLRIVRYYVDAGLAPRILFGSDFPFNHSHSQIQVLHGVKELGLDPDIERSILGANIVSLLEEGETQ